MRINDLERILRDMGYVLVRNSKHKVWNNGSISVAVPHQREINKMVTKKILKDIKYNGRS